MAHDEEARLTVVGDGEDVARRKQLANVAFHKMKTLWLRRHHNVSEELGLRFYNAFVLPVLLYNMGPHSKNRTINWTHSTEANYDRSLAYGGHIASPTRHSIIAASVVRLIASGPLKHAGDSSATERCTDSTRSEIH